MLKKLPKELLERLKLIYSKEELKIIKKGFDTINRNVTFRINTLKTTTEETLKILKEKGLKIEKIPFLENSYKLLDGKEKDLWDLNIFKRGFIYMQGLSSQLPVNFMDLKEGDKILDSAAAPGSKTTQIATILNNTGEILAIDNNQIRIDKLDYTIKRQGVKNTKTIKLDARKLDKQEYENYFDHIIFDAPCSSEGRINLHREKSYMYWKPELTKRNYKLQKGILNNIVPTLKNGGELIYSTCTLSPEENEAVVHFILSNFKQLKIVDITKQLDIKNSKPGITKFGDIVYRKDISKSLRILPNKDMEGFFIAKFIKE